jgi:hypothetical protein
VLFLQMVFQVALRRKVHLEFAKIANVMPMRVPQMIAFRSL